MPEHDLAVVHSQCPGRTNILEVPSAEKFGPHHTNQCHPTEEQHDQQKPPEIRFDKTGQDDQQVELGHARPDFHEPLKKQVRFPSVIPLDRAGDDADDAAEKGQHQPEQHGNPETIDQTCDHIPALVIRAKPIFRSGEGWSRAWKFIVNRTVAITYRRPKHPTFFPDQFRNKLIPIFRLRCELSAEFRFRNPGHPDHMAQGREVQMS